MLFREYCFKRERERELTEFCDKHNEFCERLGKFALAHKTKNSLSSVFEAIRSETVFGPFPTYDGSIFWALSCGGMEGAELVPLL